MKTFVKIMRVNNDKFTSYSLEELRKEGINEGDIILGEYNKNSEVINFKSPKTNSNCVAYIASTCKKLSDLIFSELSANAQDIFLSIENTWQLRDKKSAIINALVKKSKKEELSLQKLIDSSCIEKLCSLGVKECKKSGNLNITSMDRKEFKSCYSQYLLDEVESQLCNL